uniref:Uncharacterized protein n=1 Tax=Timema shepardi TaxID=629360 RepID=A0A7R9AYT4_TIMSH|nr:unnamed protein product [Timema shepardi]
MVSLESGARSVSCRTTTRRTGSSEVLPNHSLTSQTDVESYPTAMYCNLHLKQRSCVLCIDSGPLVVQMGLAKNNSTLSTLAHHYDKMEALTHV